MTNLQLQNDQLKKAIQYLSDIKKQNSEIDLMKLIDEACFRYDLNPKDSEFLLRFVKDEIK